MRTAMPSRTCTRTAERTTPGAVTWTPTGIELTTGLGVLLGRAGGPTAEDGRSSEGVTSAVPGEGPEVDKE